METKVLFTEIGAQKKVFGNSVLSLQILLVDDQRCPSTVKCVWEGNALVIVQSFLSDLQNTVMLETDYAFFNTTYPIADRAQILHGSYLLQMSSLSETSTSGNQKDTYIFQGTLRECKNCESEAAKIMKKLEQQYGAKIVRDRLQKEKVQLVSLLFKK